VYIVSYRAHALTRAPHDSEQVEKMCITSTTLSRSI
jgi:hypothetical protein